ncbi:MAG: MBOAT family protein [Planctomycetes bacterium]|nr:MBOAT family protein [Planctomycetota bacterium]MBI3845670.1 MBOAT family protein [Planctomycetota bacterium]
MVFSSTLFLFLFLPLVLAVYFVVPKSLRNPVLLIANLVFYAWGEVFFVAVMLLSIVLAYVLGLWVDRVRGRASAKWVVAIAVAINVGLLAVFKYGNFIVDNVNVVLALVHVPPLHAATIPLPLGISFFTFQALSYVIDVYRNDVAVQKNPLHLAVYKSLFPQLIAGPIVRYRDVASQIVNRVVTREGFAIGVRRFVVGLGKKMLIANVVAIPADAIFALPVGQVTSGLAWLATACYALQIYFDFSAYSDMAIGLGRMLGFTFLENFDYPYISESLTEFWRRWHISLSTWFRDYLYIPLGGSRMGPARTYFNLVTVFFLCGLWHGHSWTFVVWGLFHGAFLVIERLGVARWLAAVPSPVRRIYTLLLVLIGWVFFRADTFQQASGFLTAMAGFGTATGIEHRVSDYWNAELAVVLVAGVVGSAPILATLGRLYERIRADHAQAVTRAIDAAFFVARDGGLVLVLLASATVLSAGTHNPFIYFRF